MAPSDSDGVTDPDDQDPNEAFRDLLREFLSGQSDLDPSALAGAAGLPTDPAIVARLVSQLRQALDNSGGGINWNLATEQARALANRSAVASTPAEYSAFEQAFHVAALWLDEATEIAPLTAEPAQLTRAGWTEATMPVWTQLAEPVAAAIADALTSVLEEQLPETPLPGVGNPANLMRSLGGTLFAMQLGAVVGQLAGEVVSGGDIGIPLLDGEVRQAALVPQNVDAFGADLDVPLDQVRLYLAVRELAHARLFRQAKWLRLHLVTQIRDSARDTRVDVERLQELAENFDPRNPEELRGAFERGELLQPRTEAQQAALGRLETMLALIEGWVDVVTAAATARLPKRDAIAEMVRRRRAAGGPAESAFSTLVGLELRPRRLREAAAMWQAVTDAVGATGRDALWAHPDLLPTDADIDDPAALVARLTGPAPEPDDLDREITELLGGE